MINKIISRKNGYVLVYVILAIVLAGILASALYTSVFLTNKLFMQQQNDKFAYYAAVSGVEYARYIIRSGHYVPPTDKTKWPDAGNGLNLPEGGHVLILIARSGSNYTITSTGTYSDSTKTLTVICTSYGGATSWKSS